MARPILAFEGFAFGQNSKDFGDFLEARVTNVTQNQNKTEEKSKKRQENFVSENFREI